MTKFGRERLRLVSGLGIEGDVHSEEAAAPGPAPKAPNRRQVHLMAGELHDELAGRGFSVSPGQMGENVTTRGLDLLALPLDTRLHIGAHAVVAVTGRRHPCQQLDDIAPGLMRALLDRDARGAKVTRAGIMAVVLTGGEIEPGDLIEVELPDPPYAPLPIV